MTSQDDLFHPVIELPEPTRRARYDRLVGLDETKLRLRKEAALLADPRRLRSWAAQYHGGDVAALALFADRAPLFVSPVTSAPASPHWPNLSAATSPTGSVCRCTCTGSSSPPAVAASSAR